MSSLVGAFNGISDFLLTGGQKMKPIEKDHPVTLHPKVHKILVNAVGWEKGLVGFTVGEKNMQFATSESLVFIQDFLSKRYPTDKIMVPKNALSVSFVNINFEIGKSAQDFLPSNHTMPSDSFFSYQMLSKNSQATFYNEDGIAYLAGICYYLRPYGKQDYYLFAENTKMRSALMMAVPFPHQDRKKSDSYVKFQSYGRDCKTAGKRVLVEVSKEGEARHKRFDYRRAKLIRKSCKECNDEHRNYKFVPKKEEKPVEKKVVEPEELKELEEPKKKELEPVKVEKKVEKKEQSKEPKKEDESIEDIVEKDPEEKKDFDFCDEMSVLSFD